MNTTKICESATKFASKIFILSSASEERKEKKKKRTQNAKLSNSCQSNSQ